MNDSEYSNYEEYEYWAVIMFPMSLPVSARNIQEAGESVKTFLEENSETVTAPGTNEDVARPELLVVYDPEEYNNVEEG